MTRRSKRHRLFSQMISCAAAGLGLVAGAAMADSSRTQNTSWLQSELVHSGFFSTTAARTDDVLRVRVGGDASQTRVVIDLANATDGDATLSADGRNLTLNLSQINVRAGQKGGAKGLISAWSLDGAMGGAMNGAKLRLSFASGARVMRRFVLPPADGVDYYRYVIDIVPKNQAVAIPTGLSSQSAAIQLKAQVTVAPSDPRRKKVIIIDAGHGGKDPGALGKKTLEKDVNLGAAKALRDQLVATGRYRVIMTRDTDSFVDLPARVRIARNANADLFISLHSDSAPSASVSGASIYTLSDSGTERAARKALAGGDWSNINPSADNMVERILIDLTQRATKNRSAIFAQLVLDRLEGSTPLLRTSNRQAGFAVLLAPDVPAVLLEMGFVNNAADERLLSDPMHRVRMMGQVANAIDAYFESQKRGPTLASMP
jgi:N-acetylmuramoyl-L-alanine amidase